MEKHYASWRRIPKYFVSFLVSLAFLSIAFLFMCCSLNMQVCVLRVLCAR